MADLNEVRGALIAALRRSQLTPRIADLPALAEAAVILGADSELEYLSSVISSEAKGDRAINGELTPEEVLALAKAYELLRKLDR